MADVTDNVERPPPLAGTEILDLPPEMLTKICKATIAITGPRPTGIRDLMNLGATCKTLNTLVRPVLYRHFDSIWLEMLKLPSHDLPLIDTPRFFKLLVCMKKSSATDLVRYADLDTITATSCIGNWNYASRDEFLDPWIDNVHILQSLEELGLKPEFIGNSDCVGWRSGNRMLTPLSVLVAIFMSFFRNALALRLPVDCTTDPPLLDSKSSCCVPYPTSPFVDVRYAATSALTLTPYLLRDGTENPPQAFPSLQELELSGADSINFLIHEYVNYFTSNAPHLRTLRLRNFLGLSGNHRDFNLGSLTSITLLGCSLSYLGIRGLALMCPELRKFKISQSELYRDVSLIWDGKGEFCQTYEDQDPDEDDKDDEHEYSIGDMDSETEELYMPYSSAIVSSSLVLQALTPLAESLESIFLGKCQFVRAGYEGLNYRRRKLDFSPFKRLQTLGIWADNLFSYQTMFLGHGRLKPADDAFSEILRDCPTIKNLHVFNTWVWPTEGTSDFQADPDNPVERALRRLSEDLMQTNSSESTATSPGKVGPSLRLVRLCHRYDEPISPGSSSLHPYPVEEGATVMGEPVTELLIRSSESDADEKGESFWGLRPPKINDSVVERFRDRGIEFVNLRGKHMQEMERRFPYPSELDEILLDP
ncbi:hypothetical protein V8F33_012041 [Rhypophila sp. PSN 637]